MKTPTKQQSPQPADIVNLLESGRRVRADRLCPSREAAEPPIAIILLAARTWAFHLCYYSGKMFSIQDITQLNYEYLNEETIIAINNVLKKGLLAEIKDVHSPFFQHNLITILHLWEDIILNNKTLIDACRSVEELFSNIKDRLYKEYKGRNCALLPIIDGVLDKLQRQIDS